MTSLTTFSKKKPGEYTREDVEKLLAYIFNGGQPWRDETAPDQDMPKAKGNPSHGGTTQAELIDIKRAWAARFSSLQDPEALFYHYGNGMTYSDISRLLGTPRQTISDRLAHDVGLLAQAATRGDRP